jgi:hypothetical protein
VALIGAIVLTGLTSGVTTTIQSDPRIDAQVCARVGVAVKRGIDVVSADQAATTAAIMDDYAEAQPGSLNVGWLTAALLALRFTRALPHDPPTGRGKQEEPALSPSSA